MSKPSPTGRLVESQPEIQDFPFKHRLRPSEAISEVAEINPGAWERLERRAAALGSNEFFSITTLRPSQGKSWVIPALIKAREAYLAEQRRVAHFGIKQAIAAYLKTFKR